MVYRSPETVSAIETNIKDRLHIHRGAARDNILVHTQQYSLDLVGISIKACHSFEGIGA